MKVLIDVRLLGRGAHSGIPVFTREVTERLIHQYDDSFELLYPGLRKEKLPNNWVTHPRVSILDWRVPNKALDITTRWFHKPDISRHTSADIILSPHLNNLTKGSLPRVLTIHDLSFAHHPDFFSPKQRAWHFLQDWQRQIQEAEHLIAVSQYTKEDIIRTTHVAPDKISVVYPGIDRAFRPIDPHDGELLRFQKRHRIRSPYFLYFGALEARKNIIQLIEAFNLLRTNPRYKDYELILAGSPGYRASEIVQTIRRSQSKSSIRILSRITDDERKFLYNGAVAFVCTSFFEGFGFPVLEAQACGIPIIASRRTSFIETLGASAPLVNPWKPSELADALMDVTISASTRSRTIAAGLENIKRFDWDATARAIHAVLNAKNNTTNGY